MKHDSGEYAVFTEQPSASQMTASEVTDVIARPPECARQGPTHPLHPNKTGGRSKVAQNAKVRMSRFMDTSSTTQVAKVMVKH